MRLNKIVVNVTSVIYRFYNKVPRYKTKCTRCILYTKCTYPPNCSPAQLIATNLIQLWLDTNQWGTEDIIVEDISVLLVDTSLFFFSWGQHIIFVLVYIDDIIVASSSQDLTTALVKDLEEFSLKDLGDVHYFLGIEVSQKKDGLVLTQ